MLGCGVCQQEKSGHRLPTRLLELLTLLERKWDDVNMDSIVGLPRSGEGHNGILTVVYWAVKVVHLVVVQQIVSVSTTA